MKTLTVKDAKGRVVARYARAVPRHKHEWMLEGTIGASWWYCTICGKRKGRKQ